MKQLYLLPVLLLAFAACRKNDIPADSGCISRIHRVDFHLPAADSVAAISTLQQNKITYSDLDLEYISTYTVGDTAFFQSIFVIQEVNGLPVLSGDLWYQFKKGTLQTVTGTRYKDISLDTRPARTLPQLRAAYLAAVDKYGYGANIVSDVPFAGVKDSCVVAEFGYYDLNATVNGAPPNIVKAWSVSPTPGSYPQAIFRDDNGKLIIYNGGVVPLN
jgi:hypothetical protein